MTFPGASADREDARYVVVGAPLDATTTFMPGTRFGPDRIRRYSRTFDDYDRRSDAHFSAQAVHDAGDVEPWDDVSAYLSHLAAELRAVRLEDAVPVMLGGEHTVSWSGVRATEPDVFLSLDAHLDLRAAYDGNPVNHACVTRRILDGAPGDTSEDAPADTSSDAPGDTSEDSPADDSNERTDETAGAELPTAQRAVIVGARTGSPAEWDRAEADDVTVVSPEAVGDWTHSIDPSADVYLSIDIDGADPSVAPGTGTMEPFGLAARSMREVVRAIAPQCVACDVVEVNDRDDGQAAALAAKLVREFVYTHAAADES